MIEGVDKSPLGELDKGSDRETRVPLCLLRTACVLARDHEGICSIAIRKMPPKPPNYGPTRKR